jgi:heme-degrading monooxygenase HmoA
MIVVLFKSRPSETVDAREYGKLGQRLRDTVSAMPGFVDLDVFENAARETLIVGKFEDDQAEAAWRDHPDHLAAQARRGDFYTAYEVQVCRVMHAYEWRRDAGT